MASTARRYAKKSPAAAKAVAKELHDQLTQTVETLVSSDAWPKLLAAMTAKNKTEIARYSFNNMLLLLMQCPEATAVCSSKAWGERGRWMRKGTKALRIYAPINVKAKAKDGETPKGRDDKDNSFVSFRMIPVFDVSQTEPAWHNACTIRPATITPALGGPAVVVPLTGTAPVEMRSEVAGQIEKLGYTIEYGSTGGAMGFTDPKTKTVRISDTASEAQAAKTLAHELAHILADHVSDLAEYRKHQGAAETVAESFAYMVSSFYGLDTATYSAPYIATWAGRDPEEVSKALQACGSQVLTMFRKYLLSIGAPEAETLAQVNA